MEEEYKLGNTTQEFEELFGNVPFEDIDKIKKWLFNNFIPISVIQEKIDELEERKRYVHSAGVHDISTMLASEDCDEKIALYEELLEERKK